MAKSRDQIDARLTDALDEKQIATLQALEIEAAQISISSLASLATIGALDHRGGGLGHPLDRRRLPVGVGGLLGRRDDEHGDGRQHEGGGDALDAGQVGHRRVDE